MPGNLSDLIDTVQKNCMIADARHARDMTMCTFLLEMREYFRWEMELPYGARLPKDELGDWLNARESQWDAVEEEDFAPLPLSEAGIDPFDANDVNRALIPQGLVYSSGLGRFRKPHFVLAELKRAEVREGVQVLVAGCEYARDLIAPPAAMRDGAIFLRMDAVRRFLWNKYEEWSYKERDSALGRAFAHYDLEREVDRGLDRMAEAEAEAMILHEVGEARAERLLGPAWAEMLGRLNARHAELLARAVRDHLADCLARSHARSARFELLSHRREDLRVAASHVSERLAMLGSAARSGEASERRPDEHRRHAVVVGAEFRAQERTPEALISAASAELREPLFGRHVVERPRVGHARRVRHRGSEAGLVGH